jgi:membrane protein
MKAAIFFGASWALLKQTTTEFIDHKAMKLSAALAYYTIFSLAPMLIVIIALCSIFYGREAIEGRVYNELNEFIGKTAALQIQEVIKNTSASRNNIIATVIGLVTLIVGATGVFSEIQDSINMIWGIKVVPKRGWLKLLMNRVLSFSMVISIGFLLMVSLLINAVVTAFGDKLAYYFPDLTLYLFHLVNYLLTFGIITLLFAIIFKVLPDAKIKWKDVTVGAIFTAFLFIIGKLAITFYLGKSTLGVAYGAAGSIIIILIWVYYSSIILYFGAEFTQVYARKHGGEITPTGYAVLINHMPDKKKNVMAEASKDTILSKQ